MEFVATCAMGLEASLAHELRSFSCPRVRPLIGQVSWSGSLQSALTACLWSRIASRISLILARGNASTANELYELVHTISWKDHIPAGATIAIDAHGTNEALRSTHFTAQRAKDAVADSLAAQGGFRPNVDLDHPDIRIAVRITRGGASVGLDLSGDPLFRRGHERFRGGHDTLSDLRADYAAALLHFAGWHTAHQGSGRPAVYALFPGAGTLAVEAAAIALDRAPGLLRTSWGHTHWLGGDRHTWNTIIAEAHDRADAGATNQVMLYCHDIRRTATGTTTAALRTSGLNVTASFISPARLADETPDVGTAVADLSWIDGTDLARQAQALEIIAMTGDTLATKGWQGSKQAEPARPHAGPNLAILSRDDSADVALDLEPEEAVATKIGRDMASFRIYECMDRHDRRTLRIADKTITVLVDTSDQFVARLGKVAKSRSRWARREDVSCYRVYDADLPDYNLSIDLFEEIQTSARWLQISEYAPPRSVDPARARLRLLDAISLASVTLEVDPTHIVVRTRSRAKGGSQYANENRTQRSSNTHRNASAIDTLPPGSILVDEGGLTFEVNFSARHDCGLFLDHRDTRTWIRELAKTFGREGNFLNLFCYTGSATCYAADGGCAHTTSVDLSAPSLAWARRNMRRNGFASNDHRFLQADALRWLSDERHGHNRYDLIFCDVPTFSNSKRMGHRSFDVQRDHVDLIIAVSRLLKRSHNGRGAGIGLFSCNLRTFHPDQDALARAGVKLDDVSRRTIPEDFSRTPNIHHCYLINRT